MRSSVPDTVSAFHSVRADHPLVDLKSGDKVVAGSERRYPGEGGAMLVLHAFADRRMVSTQHELTGEVKRIIRSDTDLGRPSDKTLRRLIGLCQRRLADPTGCHSCFGLLLCCTEDTYVFLPDPNVRRITRGTAPAIMARLRSERMPDNADCLLADAAAFAYFLDERPVAFAATHPVGSFPDQISDVMAGTAEAFRRRRCGKKVVSATTGAQLGQGRIAVYGTTDDNVAPQRTALAVGYETCCRAFEVRFSHPA